MYRRILVAVENSSADATILAHVSELESIEDPDRRAACERRVLILARRLAVEAPSFADIAAVTAAARATA